MKDPGDAEPSRQATRHRPPGPPRQRTSRDGTARPPSAGTGQEPPGGGRAAARKAARAGDRGRKRRRARPPSRRKRVLRIVLGVISALVLITAGGGAYLYEHLSGNIKSVAIGGGGKEKADSFGRTPINVLVIGSDGRNSKDDCKLGGGCGSSDSTAGHNADVEMVVHISADRSNATAMSIPRDTMTRIPACQGTNGAPSTPGYEGQINSALQYGPACQVKTVRQLTGITIDHFVMLDFAGVVKMSDAVGGVSVCVSDNVYDTYSHLKLSKGQHTLKGDAALEFVRTRHGLGDGSDLSRTYAQHIFLSAMIRKLKSAGTLSDPTKVYALADTATKAMTVDTGLGSIAKLIGLADDLNKVPPKRITFTTMQTGTSPTNANRVIPAPSASALFAAIANDKPLTSPDGKKTSAGEKTGASKSPASGGSGSSPSPSATVAPSDVTVSVDNGTSTSGRAAAVGAALTAKGFGHGTYGNASTPQAKTELAYGPGQKAQAQTVADALGLPSSRLSSTGTPGVVLTIGADWTSGTSFPGGSGSGGAKADTHAAVSGAHVEHADDSTSCAKVSKYKTVEINGVPMTPSQAYAASPNKKDSAP
ncbi:LCP family protein [Streptomyces montanisoli]|uniref:LCP family protein n=1 Tax=Streptomyces montanisoli TaxID=2798581 RepID=A0A940MIV4_9ACTN|nr:LCP family protein [Streptomyces montanisoli]MBP0461006.1 LCP family protein [Streptomyces montanisoli]